MHSKQGVVGHIENDSSDFTSTHIHTGVILESKEKPYRHFRINVIRTSSLIGEYALLYMKKEREAL